MANVIFKFGTRAQYDALVTKDSNTLYWLSDTQELIKGITRFGKGQEATIEAAGLLSAEDKKKLDELVAGGVLNLVPVDTSVLISKGEDDSVSIGIQLSKVEGNILSVKEDGLFAQIDAIPIKKVSGLEERLQAVESAVVGGIRYKGSVPTYDDLPTDATQGDLWEVTEDNSEWCWNGEKWFEYGNTHGIKPVAYANLNEDQLEIDESKKLNIVGVNANLVTYRNKKLNEALPDLFVGRNYEVTDGVFGDTLVTYRPEEIRVMYAADTVYTEQTNTGGNINNYYMGFRAYAPDDAVSFKEDLAKTIKDETMYSFENNDFAGTDKYGRKYSIVWLPVAARDENGNWTYYGAMSADGQYIGWYYSVEWYNADGKVIAADTVRINLSNENCHTDSKPYYMQEYAKTADVVESITWQDL